MKTLGTVLLVCALSVIGMTFEHRLEPPPITVAVAESTAVPTAPPSANWDSVFISPSGVRYHAKPTCSSMKTATEVPVWEAETMGRTACKICWKEDK